jgi:signal transduction histidine kinase
LKYSKASHLTVILKIIHNKINLTVRDNGIGFNTEERSEGIGLNNIKKRVELFLGSFKINSAIGRGCEIMVELPIQKAIKGNG